MRAAGQNTSITDVAMAMPSIRLLSSVSMTRRLVFGLVGSLPEYSAFFALLAVLMWVYAVTGVFWFAGLMEEAGFSTLINALGAMFQVCVAVAVAVAVWLCGCVAVSLLVLLPGGGGVVTTILLTFRPLLLLG